MESDNMALSMSGNEVIWIRQLLFELEFPQKRTLIFQDNNACISFANNKNFNTRAKHIDISYFWIKEKLDNLTFELRKVLNSLERVEK
jgi:hypothetical protein